MNGTKVMRSGSGVISIDPNTLHTGLVITGTSETDMPVMIEDDHLIITPKSRKLPIDKIAYQVDKTYNKVNLWLSEYSNIDYIFCEGVLNPNRTDATFYKLLREMREQLEKVNKPLIWKPVRPIRNEVIGLYTSQRDIIIESMREYTDSRIRNKHKVDAVIAAIYSMLSTGILQKDGLDYTIETDTDLIFKKSLQVFERECRKQIFTTEFGIPKEKQLSFSID